MVEKLSKQKSRYQIFKIVIKDAYNTAHSALAPRRSNMRMRLYQNYNFSERQHRAYNKVSCGGGDDDDDDDEEGCYHHPSTLPPQNTLCSSVRFIPARNNGYRIKSTQEWSRVQQ